VSPGAGAGYSLAGGGDPTGDGVNDLVVGAWLGGPEGGQQGTAHLVAGHSASGELALSLASAEASFVGEHARDSVGAALCIAPDVNGDGIDDLLLGAPRNHGLETGNPYWAGCGQTYLVLGRRSGWESSMPLDRADASFIGEGDGDVSGQSVAGLGDVDGDGLGDILIGAPNSDTAGTNAGEAHLVLGRREGLTMRMSLASAEASFTGESANDQAGWAVTGLGDLDGDGRGDFAIGAKFSDRTGHNAGQVYLILTTR
jgi:hypothetical protein